MAGTTCNCGHELFDSRGCCPACYERQQRRHQRLSGRVSPASTPPPSQLNSPRQSGERSRLSSIAESNYMPSPAIAAITSAFTDEGRGRPEVSLFPSHLYQAPRRPSSRKSESSERSQRTHTFRHSEDHVGPIVSQLQGPITPRVGSSSPIEQAYSPLGAGFARMNQRGTTREQREMVNEKRLSQRGSLDLAVRMFDGPA
ncbi:hypothetical protein LTR78_003080 [Recurvomyces mirabilis]|uniref:Uncharacterized protein n=1 Tax=Recurvomyces mirabilis TaxID=574656 RepID=A0AAE0WSA7_9PEZI|nr:hypothetical protein LTR78_003080 [Recurvomyces mirabilis]KAK5157098.1 hypothetical protein LTS14_004616 [Recurvomyces mirabilis]